jgi:drug/metabolite transporter (DMT)-like permease
MSRAMLFIILANVLGGLSYPWQKLSVRGISPGAVAAIRCIIGLVLLGGLMLARREPLWPFARRETGRLALLGTVGFAVPLYLGTIGVHKSTSSNASILILLEPVSIVLFARLLLGERMGTRRALALALGIAGALVVVTEGFTASLSLLRGDHFFGNVLLALSGLLWGLYTPLMKPIAADRSPLALTFGVLAFASLVFVPVALLEPPSPGASEHFASSLAWTVVLGVFLSFLGTLLWNSSLRGVSANAVATLILIQPVVAVVAGYLQLDERVTKQAALGGALVAAGVLLTLSAEKRAA